MTRGRTVTRTEEAGPLARLRAAADEHEGTSRLADALQDYLSVKASSLVHGAARRLGSAVERLGSGDSSSSPVAAEVGSRLAEGKNAASALVSGGARGLGRRAERIFRGKDSGSDGAPPVVITEDLDVGVPVRVAYDQWTRLPEFGAFTRGVRNVERTGDASSHWEGRIFWSSRSWDAVVTEQVPDERIAWSTESDKGTMRGVVTFHALGPSLTRVLLLIEYRPKGLMERTGNLWRAQGRRVRADFKNYRRRVMMLGREGEREVEGWRGEIRGGEVVLSHEDALALEEAGLTAREWAELEDLSPEEREELAGLDDEEREALAALGAERGRNGPEGGPDEGFEDEEDEPEDGAEEEPAEDEDLEDEDLEDEDLDEEDFEEDGDDLEDGEEIEDDEEDEPEPR
ncbi:SRPBCC family protein [Nocardiopsis sp. MT53]|uniref:SRPBCC family protein n=1 Tax=Nocardiopsis changdeensis TaxID=2831969 RepID=A0ABX8BLS7_9ACTN|nr:SRPBCC family protein [Nocardiopsis changdeensis]QYX39135.1 SRPBCC family protein [Nocardiopsis sp. MT53]